VVTAPAQGGSLLNSATVSSTTTDPNPANNTASAGTTVTASADLSILKTGPATVTAGASVGYTLLVTDNGPSDAAAVSVTDTLPAGVTFVSATGTGWTCANAGNVSVTCTTPALATGSSAPAITVTVTAPVVAVTLTNTAVVSAATADPDLSNNTSSVATGVATSADLALVKTGPPTVTAGGSVTYQLVVTNNGPSAAAAVSVTDTLPAGVTFVSAIGAGWTCTNNGDISVTCTVPSLAAGATAPTITLVVTAPPQATTLTNTASVSSTTNDPAPGNNTSSVTTGVGASADLALVKTGPATVVAGGAVTYILTATNAGPSDAVAVSVTDTLPAGVTFVSATGTGWTCTNVGNVSVTCTVATLATGAVAPAITVVVTAPAQAGSLSNTASVSSTTADPNPANNTSSVATTVTASADLALVKTGPAAVTAAGSVTYQLVVTNHGPSDAAGVSVTDTLPAGVTFVSATGTGWTCTNAGNVSVTCTVAALATGAVAPTITVVVTAPDQGGSLVNSASVTATTADPNPADNTSTTTTAVTASADLAIVKAGPATVVAGGSVTYTLDVTDNGPSDAAGVSVTDTLPAGVTFVSAAGTGWTCTNAGNVSVTCTLPALATGTSAPTITVVVGAPAAGGSLVNTATVTSTTADPTPANNTSSVTTTATPSADLSIVKTGPATALAGGSVSYLLAVTNNGPSAAASVSVTDTLPAGVTFVSAAGSGWSCTNTGDVSVTCTRPTLAPGAAPAITLVVTAPTAVATLSNTAAVSATTSDPDPANNTSTVSTSVVPAADLSIVKTGPASVTPGGSVTYSLAVANAGPSDAAAVSVTDTLPAGVTFVSATGTGWTCTNAGNASVTCTLPTLATGTSAAPISVVVTAPIHAAVLANTSAVTSSTADPDPSNNSSSVSTAVGNVADLSLLKTGPTTVTAGSDVTYHLVVTNSGPDAADAVTVTDTLPPGVTFVSASGPGWHCTHAGNVTVTCTLASLASGTSAAAITVVVKAPQIVTSLKNTANVTSTTFDPIPDNNTSAVPTSVLPSKGGGGTPLPHTGAGNGLLAAPLGLVLLVLGGVLIVIARRRRTG
jgi:uncharacterized repeat protein (TIGR01451 family)